MRSRMHGCIFIDARKLDVGLVDAFTHALMHSRYPYAWCKADSKDAVSELAKRAISQHFFKILNAIWRTFAQFQTHVSPGFCDK